MSPEKRKKNLHGIKTYEERTEQRNKVQVFQNFTDKEMLTLHQDDILQS